MKNLLYIILFLLSVPMFSQGVATPDAEMTEAEALYKAEKFADAAKKYENILTNHRVHSPELYLNLGNTYYKMNMVGPAVFNYEKGLLLDPGHKAIKNNLKFAHKMMLDEVNEVPAAGFGAMIRNFTGSYSYDAWAWIAVIAEFLFFASFAGYYFMPKASQKRIFFFAMMLFLLCTVIAVASAYFERDRDRSERPAIVFSAIAVVKSEPKTNASDVATIHEGTKVYVLQDHNEWRRVQLPDGNDGYIEAGSIKELKASL